MISVRGVITSRAFFSENSNTPPRISASEGGRNPPSPARSTRSRSSSGECGDSSSDTLFCPRSRSRNIAEPFNTQMNGQVIQVKIRIGGASHLANCSG